MKVDAVTVLSIILLSAGSLPGSGDVGVENGVKSLHQEQGQKECAVDVFHWNSHLFAILVGICMYVSSTVP